MPASEALQPIEIMPPISGARTWMFVDRYNQNSLLRRRMGLS